MTKLSPYGRETTERLGNEPVGRLLRSFVLPSFVGLITYSLYNVVDRIFVGWWVGVDGLSALTVVYPAMLALFGAYLMLGSGASSLLSLALGAGDKRGAELVLGNALALGFVVSGALTGAGLLLGESFLATFGADAHILPHAWNYLRIILLGLPFMVLGFLLNSALRAEGKPRFAVLMMLASSLANIVFDAVFILGFNMGVEGAALATVVAEASAFGLGAWFYLSRRSELRPRKSDFSPRPRLCLRLLSTGFPASVMDIAYGAQNALVNRLLLIYGGTPALAAMGIIVSLETFAVMPAFALADGMQPLVGYNYGARKFDRVRATLRLASWLLLGLSALVLLPVELIPEWLVKPFCGGDAALEAVAARGLSIYMTAFPFYGIYMLSSRYFQATGHVKTANFIALSKPILFFAPVVYGLAWTHGLDGLWAAEPVSAVLGTLVACCAIAREYHALRKRK